MEPEPRHPENTKGQGTHKTTKASRTLNGPRLVCTKTPVHQGGGGPAAIPHTKRQSTFPTIQDSRLANGTGGTHQNKAYNRKLGQLRRHNEVEPTQTRAATSPQRGNRTKSKAPKSYVPEGRANGHQAQANVTFPSSLDKLPTTAWCPRMQGECQCIFSNTREPTRQNQQREDGITGREPSRCG